MKEALQKENNRGEYIEAAPYHVECAVKTFNPKNQRRSFLLTRSPQKWALYTNLWELEMSSEMIVEL